MTRKAKPKEEKEKRPVGRPRAISSPEEMDRLVENYLQMCNDSGTPITLTGLILALGLSCRDSLDEYKKYPGFSDSVKRAKLYIENAYENRLCGDKPTGPIFALKNFGWSDKSEVDVTSSDGSMTPKAPIYTIVNE